MNPLTFLAQPTWRHLVFALLHTLWQGAVLAILLVLALRMVSVRRPLARYALSMAAQFGVLLAGLATWAILEHRPTQPLPGPSAALTGGPAGADLPQFRPALTSPSLEWDRPAPRHLGWVQVIAIGWLAGVTLMLTHTTGSTLAAVRLTRGPLVRNRELLALVDNLCRDIGIRCRVRVVSCGDNLGPCVLGVIWPTILLPVTFATGLPADDLRAILAHELAHIRRRDYLWNLAQMLVESLLFFNPVVWWLGRQVRIEREACCDATAVAVTGRPLDYSRTLAGWAERVRMPFWTTAAVAWGGPRHPSPLRERILRILRPGERPRTRISWGGLLVLLLAGPIVLFGLHRGTLVAVKLAAQVLAPAERLERLKVAQAEYAPRELENPGVGKITIKGTIRTSDGLPLLKPVPAFTFTRSQNSSTMSRKDPLKETFSFESNAAGSTYLSVQPDDYAPTFVGPFQTRRGQTVEGINIRLEPGFPTRVLVVDEQEVPVVGARVGGGLVIEGGTSYNGAGWVTDGNGIAIIPHASRRPYRLNIAMPGFQPFSAGNVTLKPAADTTLTLTHARPTRGIIVTKAGEPIAGAQIRTFFEDGLSGSWNSGGLESPIATTDSEGRFTLDRLEDGKTYAFLIETPTEGRFVMTGVKPGQTDLRWSVDRERVIKGTITGDLATLDRSGGKPIVRGNQTVAIPDSRRGQHSERLFWSVPVEPTDGGGSFRVTGLLPGVATLTAAKQTVRLVVERPEHSVAIDLSQHVVPPNVRRVVFRIVTPDGAVRPSGSAQIRAVPREVGPPVASRSVPIEEGKVTFDAPVPGFVSYEAQGVVGYWFPSGSFDLEPGIEPKEVEVRGVPAGAIVGQVFDPDGRPAVSRVSVRGATVETPPSLKGKSISAGNRDTDTQGRFFLSPLPIGGTYLVAASHGRNIQVSKRVKLDGTRATERVEIRLAKPVAASGRVLGPDGRPLSGLPVTLVLKHPQVGTRFGPPHLTDHAGRFRFDELSSEFGPYRAVLDLRQDYQPTEANLNPGGDPIELRLSSGHVVTGRVLDAATGWPIPGVEMYAYLPRWREDVRYAYEAEGRTDEAGRFRFSNLPDRPVNLNDRSGLTWRTPGGSRTVEPDQAGTIEIRASLPAWSELKPTKPAAE